MKRQKHPRLPNGYGSIKYMGKGRARPYRVCAPSSMVDGKVIQGKTICYVDNWYKGYAVLTAYKAGTYVPGEEMSISLSEDSEGLKSTIKRLIDDYRAITGRALAIQTETFGDVMNRWYNDKYERPDIRIFSKATKANIQKGMRKLEPIAGRAIEGLRLDDLQRCIDLIDKPTMQDQARSVLHGVYEFAIQRELVDRDYSKGVRIAAHSRTHGEPFTPVEIKQLFAMKDPRAEMLCIMIYSGFRMSAYKTIEVNLEEGYFRGGIKTAAGKDRIVPIHPAILPLVKRRLRRDHAIVKGDPHALGMALTEFCRINGMDHTPHHTRHTFSALCEKYEVKENDRKRLLGHAFQDVTNSVYGHRDLEELRKEIEKIPFPEDL